MRAFEDEFEFVFRALRRFGMSAADAEDVAQDVFVVMLRRWSDFDADRPLRPWLLGITNRVAMHHLRRTWRETPSGFIDLRDETPQPEDQLSAKGARRLVTRALAQLKDKQREILILHELEGVPMQDIAQSTGEPLQTLYSRLKSAHRAFGRIVRRMGRFPGGRALVLPLALVDRQAWPPLPEALRLRVVARARATSARVTPALPRRRTVSLGYATGASLLLAASVALVAGGHLVAADYRMAKAASYPSRAVVASPAPRPLRPPQLATALWSGPAAATTAAPLDQGLVGYWRFDEPAGSKAVRDHSGRGNDCAVQHPLGEAAEGPRFDHQALGSAAALTGKSWLECRAPGLGHGQGENGIDRLTLAVWVRPRKQNLGYKSIVMRQLGQSRWDDFFLGLHGGHLLFRSHANDIRVVGPSLPLYTWSHLAVTFDAGVTTLYLNGLEVARTTHTPPWPRPAAPSPILIGAGINGPRGSATSEHFRGAVDELVLYDRALGPAEVAALAAGQQPLAL